MKRLPLKLGLFVLAGAMVNVAVAWAFWICHSVSENAMWFVYSRSYYYACGWPAESLRQNFPGTACLTLEFRHVPSHCIWSGFAINTVFYAAILWLVCAAPFALRRWRRIKRGLCPACAYPVGASDTCTECGKPLPGAGVTPKCVAPKGVGADQQ